MTRTLPQTDFWIAVSVIAVCSLCTVASQDKNDGDGDSLPKWAVARLGTTRFRQSEVTALAISPDGKTLASGSYQGLTLWDLATGKKTSQFPGDLGDGFVAFADEGRTLLTIDDKGKVRYRESSSGKIVHELSLTNDADKWEFEISYLTRNGRFLAVPDSIGKTIGVWDLAAQKEVARIKGRAYPLAISEDGRYLARESESHGPLQVWDIANARQVRSFEITEPCYMNRLGFSPDGKTLMSLGSHNHGTRSWDIDTGKLRMAYGRAPRETYEYAFSNDGERLATLHEDNDGWGLAVWDFAANKQLWRCPVIAFVGQALVFTPDGSTLITASREPDDLIRFWDVNKGTEIRDPASANGAPRDLVSSPDGRWLIAMSNADRVLLWDLKSKTQVTKFSEAGHYSNVAFTPDSKLVAYAHQDASVRLCETESGKETFVFPKRGIDGREAVTGLAFSPDGKVLFSSHLDFSLATRSVADATKLKTVFPRRKNLVDYQHGRSLQFSRDTSVVSTEYRQKDEPFLLWNTDTGELLGEPVFSDGGYYEHHALSPDGRMFAATVNGASVRLYNATTGAQQRELLTADEREKEALSGPLAFSPDGRILATSCAYGLSAVDLWDVASGKHLQRFETLQGGVKGLTFVGPGDQLATGGRDTTILLWDLGELRKRE